MTSGGDKFYDFHEILPAREITSKIELRILSSVAVGLFLEWAQCCSINSTHVNPAGTGRCVCYNTIRLRIVVQVCRIRQVAPVRR